MRGPGDEPARPRPRDGLFLDDILASPAELAAVIDLQREAVAGLPWPLAALRRRRLVGMGSSGFAARDAAARWRRDGLDAVAEVASASGASAGGVGTLAIVISASGGTPEAIAAAARHRAEGSRVLALTASASSPLAVAADAVLPLRAGSGETAGIASQTYRATVSALLLLDPVLGPDRAAAAAASAPVQLAALLARADEWRAPAADLLDTGREVHVLADGLHAGLAEQAALMLREAPRIAAMPFDTGDWLHVGQYTLYPGDGALLFSGSPADDEAIATIRRRGGDVVVVGPAREGAGLVIPLVDGRGDEAVDRGDGTVAMLVASAVAELVAAELWSRVERHEKGRAT